MASAGLMVVVGLQAVWRVLRAGSRSREGEWLQPVLLIVVGVTIAGGLGLLVGGASPAEPLHYVYAMLAFGVVPVASFLGARGSRRRAAFATVVGAIVGLIVIVRLFQTG